MEIFKAFFASFLTKRPSFGQPLFRLSINGWKLGLDPWKIGGKTLKAI